MLKISKKRINTKIKILSLSLEQLKDKERHEKCPLCNNRLDNIVTIPGDVINDILNNFIKHIEDNKDIIDADVFAYIKKSINLGIRNI